MHEAMCTCTQECVIVESHHIVNMHDQYMGFLMLERITCSGIPIQLCMLSVGKVNHDTLIQQVILILTSGKNFIKITSVGMGAAKSNETR